MSDNAKLYLQVTAGSAAGKIFCVEKTCFIGSQSHCEICLTDPGIANMHARIASKGNVFTLTDLTKKNDVRVNGSLVKSRRLTIGDVIDIAGTVFRVIDPANIESASEEVVDPAEDVVGLTISTEDSPLTKIFIPDPVNEVDLFSRNASQPVDNKNVQHVDEEDMDPTSRKLSAIERHRLERKHTEQHIPSGATGLHNRVKFVVFLGVMLGVMLVVVGGLLWHRMGVRKELADKYHAIVDEADSRAEEPQVTLQKFKQLRSEASGKFTRLENGLDDEISRLEAEAARQEKEFQSFLAVLDARATDFIATGDFDGAAGVYNQVQENVRSKVLSARADKIKKIALQKQENQANVESRNKAHEEQKKLSAEANAREALGLLTVDVLNAVLAGKNDFAITVLNDALENDFFAPVKTQLESVTATIHLVDVYDRLNVAVGDGDENRGAKVAEAKNNLPSVARAIVLLRDGEPWEAQNHLALDAGHFMGPALKARIGMSSDALKTEKEAMLSFLNIWRQIDGTPVKTIPNVNDCIKLVGDIISIGTRSDIEKLCSELIACSLQFQGTSFVKRYTPLFDMVYRTYPSLLVKDERIIDPGNGKVIQIDNNDCFVEASCDLTLISGGQVGLFSSDQMFFVTEGNRDPLAVRVNVYALMPYTSLSSKQLKFSLPTGVKKPVLGQSVLIAQGVKQGPQVYCVGTNLTQKSVFFDDFEHGLSNEWYAAKAASGIAGGRLFFHSPPKLNRMESALRKSSEGDLMLRRMIGNAPVTLELDMFRESAQSVAVVVGDLSFLLGGNGYQKEGIYLRGNLVKAGELLGGRYGTMDHVVVIRNTKSVSLIVNGKSLSCGIVPEDLGDASAGVLFYSGKKVLLDNVKLVVSNDFGASKVVGLSADGREAVVSRGGGAQQWNGLRPGQPVYFFKQDSASNTVFVGEGIFQEEKGDFVFCSTAADLGLNASCLASISRNVNESATTEISLADPILIRPLSSSVCFASAMERSGNIFFHLDMPVRFPSQGYLYSFSEYIVHPKSSEILCVAVSSGAKCFLKQSRMTVDCKRSDGTQGVGNMGPNAVLSTQYFQAGRMADLYGMLTTSPRGGYSTLATDKNFWHIGGQSWIVKAGRMISNPDAGVVPVIVAADYFPNNVQYDVDLRIESVGRQSLVDWVKDVMVELYFPARQMGVTFGIGAKGDGGVWVGGRTVSMLEGSTEMTAISRLSSDAEVRIHGAWKDGAPVLSTGKDYQVRLRRIGDAVCLYINGKRLAYVRVPASAGDVQLRLAAPESVVSIGRSSARDLSSSCTAPTQEADIGDFGYVLKVVDNKILIDSDMYGVSEKGKVSCMAVENVITGENSKTIVLKKVASGIVVETGPRTSVVALSGVTQEVKPGMKVMVGTQPDSLIITDERMCDIDQGL